MSEASEAGADGAPPVLLDIADGIGWIRLNRPAAANGLDVELLRAK